MHVGGVDADLAGDGLGGAAVVAGEQHRAQPEGAQLGDGGGAGRLDGVGDDDEAAHLSVPADQDRGPPGRLGGVLGGTQSVVGVHRPVGEEAFAAGDDGVAVDDAGDAEPLAVGEALDGGQLESGVAGAGGDRRAIGCSEASSSDPAIRSSSSRSTPAAGTTSTRAIVPVVTVPVLSSTIVSTRRVDSRTSGPLMITPSWAPRPVPTMIAVGVARPRAHGQAMISTATAAVNATDGSSPTPSQNPSVATARAMTIGTNTAEIRSASRCTGALPLWASCTSRAIWASSVSAPTLVARTTSRPPALTVAPVTASPGPTSTGTGSPVSSEASIADEPSSTTPSVATFSPGRTTKRSPTASSSIGMRCSAPSRSTATSLAPSSSSARRAAPERRLARASK